MDYSTHYFGSFQGRIKSLQTFNAKAQKIDGKWQIVPNTEEIEAEKLFNSKGSDVEVKLYYKGRLVEHILNDYDAMGNLIKKQVFRTESPFGEETDSLEDLELDTDGDSYETGDDNYETEEADETEAVAHAESDNSHAASDANQLKLSAVEEYVYDEFNCLIKSRNMSQTSELFGSYDETITTTYNSAGKRTFERKENVEGETTQVTETSFGDGDNPIKSIETENGVLVSQTVYTYNAHQQEISRITTYADQTTEEFVFEYDQCQNPTLEITSQRDGSAVAIINKIVYY